MIFYLRYPSSNKTLNKGESYYVSITSTRMVADLERLGVIERKTGFEKIPNIDPGLIPHFLRGFFDGDGITDIVGRRSGFVSNKQMLIDIQKIIGSSQKIHATNGAYYFLGSMKFSASLYRFLQYENCKVCLERKKRRLALASGGNTEVTKTGNTVLAP